MRKPNKIRERCCAEIDLSALEKNVRALRSLLPGKTAYISVVKADAYGHGLPEVVERLAGGKVDGFAVANVEEAAIVRGIDRETPIHLISATLPEEDPRIAEYNLTPTVSSEEEVARFDKVAKAAKCRIAVQLKVDTGMGRLGVWHEQAASLYEKILEAKRLELCGVYTHLSSAEKDPNLTERQRLLFLDTLERLDGLDRKGLLIHADNTAGLDTFQPERGFNAVRIGLAQYGVLPSEHARHLLTRIELKPVCSLHGRVTLIKDLPAGTPISYGQTWRLDRDARVAVLSVGYADGVHRACGNRGKVLIRGRRCRILGSVTMDEIMVDVTDIGEAACGDTATIFGEQEGKEITIREFSKWCRTIPWEVLCSITKRVPRRYRK